MRDLMRWDPFACPLPERGHCGRARPALAADLFDEPHASADREAIERVVKDAVAVEVELLALVGHDKPIPFVREQLGDAAVPCLLVRLHVASLPVHEVLKSTSGVVERRVDRRVQVLVVTIPRGHVSDDDLSAGVTNVDPNTVWVAVRRVPVRALDGDPAARDAGVDRIELIGPSPDVRLDGVGVGNIAERDLKANRHDGLSFEREPSKVHVVYRIVRRLARTACIGAQAMRPDTASGPDIVLVSTARPMLEPSATREKP
jgi:hypothetical protein